MSVFTQGNTMSVFVNKDVAFTALASLTTDLSASMADSQITAVGRPVGGSKEQVIAAGSAAGTYDYFRLAYKVNGNVVYGPKIDLKNVINISAASTTAVAPAEQIYVMGYNGTSGSLDVSQANDFIFTIAYDHDDMMWSEQKLRNAYDYYSAAPTQKGLAQSMTAQINYKEQLGLINGTGAMVRAEMLADGSGTPLTNSRTVAVIQGSNYITLNGALTTNFAVGDLIRLGSGAVAPTDPVYVITALGDALGANTTTVFQIHTPYQGASGTIANANAGTVGTCTNYGFKITGQALSWSKDFFKFLKVKFHFDLKGFGNSTLTKTQESTKGKGYYQEVAEMESFAAGNEGILNRMVVPLPLGRQYADTTGTLAFTSYTTTSIFSTDYSLTGPSSSITGNSPMRIQQFVFFPGSGSTNGTANRAVLASQLNSLLGASL